MTERLDEEALLVAMARKRILSGSALGRLIGMSETYGRHIFKGRMEPSAKVKQRVADALGVKVSDLWKPAGRK